MAPDMFNRAKIAEALSDDPDKMLGRVAEVTAQDVTGDFSKMHIKLKFKVNDVRGMDAYTYFIGHDMTSDYVRRMTRRRKSKIDTTIDVKTRDDFIIRIKPLAISGRRIRASQQSAIRLTMGEVITRFCSRNSLDEIVKVIIAGQLARDAAVACKHIHPLQRVEIRKSEILKKGHVPPAPEEGEEEPEEEIDESAEPEEVTDGADEPEEEPEPVKEEPAEELVEEEETPEEPVAEEPVVDSDEADSDEADPDESVEPME